MISDLSILSLVEGTHGSPMDLLGRHVSAKGTVLRTLQLFAEQVELIRPDGTPAQVMKKLHPSGVFETEVSDTRPFAYRYRMTDAAGHTWECDDPYRFPPQISDFDLYLFGEGTQTRLYKSLGARPLMLDGVEGVHFAVWAPNATRVGVVGDFNHWDGRHHPMQTRGSSGVWELFIPGVRPGDAYKYEVKGRDGYLMQKADPLAFAAEMRPRTASVVSRLGAYTWGDADWIARRASADWLHQPTSVYEVHLGSWRRVPEDDNRPLTYRELADQLIPHVKDLGFTHIEVMPVTEHPYDGSWGYQCTGYFAPTSRFGKPDDFRYFVDQCHQAGLGVIVDWVPAHFPKDAHGLAYFDGTHLYEHSDPRKGEHKDWGTYIFNYGRNEVRSFLLSSATFWAEEYHIDGIRVDAVASMLYLDYSREDGEWVPNMFGGRENLEAVDFLKKFNEILHADFPGFLTFAEESTSWPMVSRPTYLGGLGFGLKWNMGWMNDTLRYFHKEPVHRKFHHGDLTFSLIYAFTENFILPFSHDEVVHGKGSMLDKMPGDFWQKFANLRLLYTYMFTHPGKKLLFMGAEFGQWTEWNCNSSLEWHLTQFQPHQQLMRLVRDLNRVYSSHAALHRQDFSWEGFQWIDLHDSEQSILSYIRKNGSEPGFAVCVLNLTPVVREGYRLGVPAPGAYEEIINSDAAIYGGSGVVNGQIFAEPVPWMGQPHSVVLRLPPLGAVLLKSIG